MNTLNKIADDVAFKLGSPTDVMLRNSIKATIIHLRATLITQDLQRNNRILQDYLQSITLELEPVDLITDLGIEVCCGLISPELDVNDEMPAFKVIGTVPKMIRNPFYRKDGFTFVGNAIRTERFRYSPLHLIAQNSLLPLSGTVTYYTKINDTYYVIPLDKRKSYCDITFEGIYEDFREDCNCEFNGFPDDKELPIPMDMITYIKRGLISGEYPLLNVDTENVEVKKDGAPTTGNPARQRSRQQQQPQQDPDNDTE